MKQLNLNINYTHPPSWLEKNWVFRKLFLLRKLFLTKCKFGHYSQFAEDISIRRCFPIDYVGFFVDVGCFHPKKYNNTWSLYRRGWRGINIDLDSIKIEGFDIMRPGDVNVSSAVSDKNGSTTYHSNGFYSLTSSMDDEFASQRSGYIEREVQCARLSDLIDQTKYKDREIDLLSVDAEGHDLLVLESLDFERYVPKLIAVEMHKRLFSEIVETDLFRFLNEKEYDLVGWCGPTLLFSSKELQRSLKN